MSVATSVSLSDTAHRVIRRASAMRRRSLTRVPQLRVDLATTHPPTVWFVCPDWNRPAGGIRKQYRAVDVLNAAGIPAAIVHRRPDFACSWFAHDTRIVAAPDAAVGLGDVIAVPEIYGASILDLPPGVRQVIFNQNAYLALDLLVEGGPAAAAPYVDNPDLAVVTVVSEHNAAVMSYVFPGTPIRRIHHGLDGAIHHPPATAPGRRIAYMPRRRGGDAAQVLNLLERRGALAGWDLVPIHGMTEREVADMLRSSSVFLSFSELEGFGLPPLEALACGCIVVGFDGFGGREFFRSPFAQSVEDGDVVAYARAVEDLLGRFDSEPHAMRAAAATGAAFACEHYSPEVERQDLLDVFAPLLYS